jgi:hypothetical protein
MNSEPFVSADVAAKHFGIRRPFLLSLARRGIAGAYPLGTGDFRKTWRFRLSELTAAITRRNVNEFHLPGDKTRYDPGRQSPLR